ncbi:hypothetical protein VB712_04515 [Spirulina sp. CCNP1310]|uniref:hypothetical protein n=1 Tax=Spirulina sp. CCNP1310 TaxID=3110249 RepID=UPI002B1F69AE|nr:hypothetical protein [Spirulina sp. CCNP1310]MEA5418478.1 hypothetical protein [Spirulina sp. CCNP1310]
MNQDRIDLSEWVIHFVHDRSLNHYPKDVNLPLPFCFDRLGKPLIHSLDETAYDDQLIYENSLDHPYGLDANARAYSVLKRILFDGYIKSGWSFRRGRASIYGPRSAVCFTEMPLYALLAYASKRNNPSSVEAYGIALRKQELFKAGGRPVIYGLSGNHKEAFSGDSYFEKGFRCLASSCGVALNEQYRYVAMNLDKNKWIDWTHEREWRWADTKENHEVPGFPIWVESQNLKLSQILVIVKEVWEVEDFLNSMKTHYDARVNIYDSTYDRENFKNTVVVSLEEIDRQLSGSSAIRLDDLPLKNFSYISPKIPSSEVLEKVKKALIKAKDEAKKAAQKDKEIAPRNKNGYICDVCGFATVVTSDANTEITDALISLNYASPCDGECYFIYEVTSGIDTEQALRVAEAAAQAAARTLSELLGQHFSVNSRWD